MGDGGALIHFSARLCWLPGPAREMPPPDTPVPDPDDLPILGCALGAAADVFVTGDKPLLDLNEVQNMPVVSPRGLWEMWRSD